MLTTKCVQSEILSETEGKVEKMIRSINVQLRTNKKIAKSKRNSLLSRLLFALRSEKEKDVKSVFEYHMNREPNTPKEAMLKNCFLKDDPQLKLSPSAFSPDVDSTILMRERSR